MKIVIKNKKNKKVFFKQFLTKYYLVRNMITFSCDTHKYKKKYVKGIPMASNPAFL